MVCGGAALAGALVILLSSGALTNRAEPAVYTAISLPPVSDPWQGDEPQCVKLPPEELATGQVGKATWQAWIPGVRFSQGERWLSVVKPGAGRTALRQAFEPSEEGSPRVLVGATLPAARTYRVVQSVYFEPEFEWGGAENQGGKFGFGLGGGTSPSGGTMDPAGFTARWMWRGNRDGTARLAVYSYAADRPKQYGEDLYLGDALVPTGRWAELVMELTTNTTIDSADGSLRAWVDGEPALELDGMRWQSAGAPPVIDNLTYAAFYGGNDPSWSPGGTTHMQVRDVCWAAMP